MRIALLFSGHVRSLRYIVRRQRRNIERLKREHDVCVFLHTWAERDGGHSSWWRSASDPVDLSEIDQRAISLLEADAVSISSPPHIHDSQLLYAGWRRDPQDLATAQNMAAMWLGISNCFSTAIRYEKRSDCSFDLFIRSRPDLLWNITREVSNYKADHITRFPRRAAASVTVSDLCFLANRDVYSELAKFVDRIPDWRNAYQEFGYPKIVPEYALNFYINLYVGGWKPFTTDLALIRDRKTLLYMDQSLGAFARRAGRDRGLEGFGLASSIEAPYPLSHVIRDVSVNAHVGKNCETLIAESAPQLLKLSRNGQVSRLLNEVEQLWDVSCCRASRLYLSSTLIGSLKEVPRRIDKASEVLRWAISGRAKSLLVFSVLYLTFIERARLKVKRIRLWSILILECRNFR